MQMQTRQSYTKPCRPSFRQISLKSRSAWQAYHRGGIQFGYNRPHEDRDPVEVRDLARLLLERRGP